MLDFIAYNPTRVLFGVGHYSSLSSLVADQGARKVLVTFGGGSVKRNGVYDRVMEQLVDFECHEFWGIEANPEYQTLMKAVELGKSKGVEFILAVGGGSVIDGSKFIAGAINYHGDPWDVLSRQPNAEFSSAIPLGTVLTLPATGSEANSGAVINRSEFTEKRTMGGPLFFPKFSILDPTCVASLPEKQIRNGIVDAYMHTLEQYLTSPAWNLLQMEQAEGILRTLHAIGAKVIENPNNVDAAANLMWCAHYALNGSLRAGVQYDWSTHMVGHELTALFAIDHAETLAIVSPVMFRLRLKEKEGALKRYGKNVLALNEDSNPEVVINTMESFFQSLGMRTKLGEHGIAEGPWIEEVVTRFTERGWLTMGENGTVTPDLVRKVLYGVL